MLLPKLPRALIALVVLLITLTSCTTLTHSRLLQRDFSPIGAQQRRLALPVLNQQSTAQVGDSMISGGTLYLRPAIRLRESVTHTGVSRGPYSIYLPAGVYYAAGRSLKPPIQGTFYQAQTRLRFRAEGNFTVKGGVFVPAGDGMTPYIYWHATDTGVPLIDPEPALEFEETTHEEWQPDSLRRELVYNGRSGDTIKLLYREFSDDMMRPAFTQEVAYDLEQGETIGFKGTRFRVYEANNVEIVYTVLSHFK